MISCLDFPSSLLFTCYAPDIVSVMSVYTRIEWMLVVVVVAVVLLVIEI